MKMRWLGAVVAWALCTGWDGACAQDAGAPPADEAEEQFKALVELGASVESPDDYRIDRWVKRPAGAKRLVKLGDTFVIQDAETGQLFMAWEEEPGRLEGGDWRSLTDFIRAAEYAKLPPAPEGWTLREVYRPADKAVRIAEHGGKLYVLCLNGDVYRVDPASTGQGERVARGRSYAGPVMAQGLCFDAVGRMYIVTNHHDNDARPEMNRVVIFRSQSMDGAATPEFKPWLTTSYPQGVGGYNHGVGPIVPGPDGMLYVGSGSRTDANEPGNHEHRSKEGEVELTSAIWRLDPGTDAPTVEIFADGLRNPFGLCFDDRGRLFATDNGPNENPPEELNLIEQGKHYGFPYVFSDWAKNPYPNVGAPPAGVAFVPPIPNVGPDAGGSAEKPIGTFDAHSSPAGLAFLDETFPEPYRGALVVARFGNMLPVESGSVGFDVAAVHLEEKDSRMVAHVTTLLKGLGRPIDVLVHGAGTLYVLEHSRQTGYADRWGPGALPGRVLELKVKVP